MKIRILTIIGLGLALLSVRADAQQTSRPNVRQLATAKRVSHASAETFGAGMTLSHQNLPDVMGSNPLPQSVSLPGSYSTGINTKFQEQTDGRSLHNVQIDPLNPLNVHAVVMAEPVVDSADTVSAGSLGGTYSTRNCFYTFSNDGGKTWSTPIVVAPTRSGFCDMVLYKVGANYVPIIALHRWASATDGSSLYTAIYIEQGAPGAGNFKEFLTDQKYPGVSGNQNIIWPRIALSPDNGTLYVAASVSVTSPANPMNIVVGTFKLGAGGTSATWQGWRMGPDDSTQSLGTATGNQAWASANYAIAVSASGKIGLTWYNVDNNSSAPDDGVYFAESSDGGVSWVSTFNPLWQPTFLSHTSGGTTTVYETPQNGLDIFYHGESARVVTGALWETLGGSTSTYVPNSGAIIIWYGDTNAAPVVLLSRLDGADTGTGQLTAIDTGAFLTLWSGQSTMDPQTPCVVYPTFAPTVDADHYAVFFECWVNDDSEQVNDTLFYPYHSIYEKHTTDDGATWSDAAPVLSNSTNTTGNQKFDYRFPETSSFNPTVGKIVGNGVLFMGDTAAGLWTTAGYPVWDSVTWYFNPYKIDLGSAGVASTSGVESLAIGNYPNPFTASTAIQFNLIKPALVNELKVTDVLGRTVSTPVENQMMSAGAHSVRFDAGNLPNGTYFCTLKVGGIVATERMVLSK